MANNERNDEINIAKAMPWILLISLVIFMFFLWPKTGDTNTTLNVSSESSETVSVEKEPAEGGVNERAVILDLLNFRSEPYEAANKIIGAVNKGESYKIIEKREKWLKIEKEDGSSGYITTDPKYVNIVSE